MVAPIDKREKLKILEGEATELAAIRGTNVWIKITKANEQNLKDVISEFATSKNLPNDPMQALIYLLKLRSEAAGCLKLVDLFNEIEDSNIAGINTILGGRPMIEPETEDTDLHAGSQI